LAAKIVDKEEKKTQIIMSAIQVFSEKGINYTKMQDIAERANIGKGTLYEYFKNKDDLINETFKFFLNFSEEFLKSVSTLKMPPDKKLKEVLLKFSDTVKQEGIEIFNLMFDFWAIGIKSKEYSSEFYKTMTNFYREYRKFFSDIVKEGQRKNIFKKSINFENIGAIITGMLDGLMAQWLLDRDNIDYIEAIKTMADVLIEGLTDKNGGFNDEN